MKPVIKAFIFDAYGTLFDVHSVMEELEQYFPEKGQAISQTWRKKQVEYFFMRQIMDRYKPFDHVTRDSLIYAVKENGQNISAEALEKMLNAYRKLAHYDEVSDVLKRLQDKELIIFSNGSDNMLRPLIDYSGLGPLFTDVISADEIKQYKPSPAAYLHALQKAGVKREEVLFMSSNGWDISGAKSFGFNTAWINRNGLPVEELQLEPDAEYRDLSGILKWV
ncbi:haloacid dehalogenase type II [Jeotgalibacillus sp. R-1-5s-1]|uniref:haloacid dehalogenase type II n=1 Tax=Jeotgalibacillus sp. R-1-5s-1 TaxID=2555897 RepID=UPI00106DCBF2|nr:haloacid dehalogenase type II [Jeotgalibacillus sp. R-1-5s-1]TFE00772.1 haloacid dehalogenase type II [Jeotgalibacillus sp. R-1-5s-1]